MQRMCSSCCHLALKLSIFGCRFFAVGRIGMSEQTSFFHSLSGVWGKALNQSSRGCLRFKHGFSGGDSTPSYPLANKPQALFPACYSLACIVFSLFYRFSSSSFLLWPLFRPDVGLVRKGIAREAYDKSLSSSSSCDVCAVANKERCQPQFSGPQLQWDM